MPGHELYGFLPYWEMDDAMPDHLAATPLTTLALFSVTNAASGRLAPRGKGYVAIVSQLGRRIIREAQARGTRVELVFTAFGTAKTRRLFSSSAMQEAAIADLTDLVAELRLDGVNVDVEGLDGDLVPAYAAFVGALRTSLRAADPVATVSVATPARLSGAAMASAALEAGADRVFMMGYDFRVAGSEPGGTAPLDRHEGSTGGSLRSVLDLYALAGVPAERLLLGLPLYGMSWPAAGGVVGAPSLGKGDHWLPRSHMDLLADATVMPVRDEVEVVDVYLLASDGGVGPRSFGPLSSPGLEAPVTWEAVYVDTPATLRVKLHEANLRGLAGAGFWAIGYERGLPGYTDAMTAFRTGELDASGD